MLRSRLFRRAFVVVCLLFPVTGYAAGFSTGFDVPDRIWIGPDFWANRLQDWRVNAGRVECVATEPRLKMRTLQLLTHRLDPAPHPLTISVKLGLANQNVANASDSALGGVLVGVGIGNDGKLMDARSAALIHGAAGNGGGCFYGVNARGQLVVRNNTRQSPPQALTEPIDRARLGNGVVLQLEVTPAAEGKSHVTLRLLGTGDDTELASHRWENIAPTETFGADFAGGIALVSHPGAGQQGRYGGRWWFDDLTLSGADVVADADRSLGPILSTMYTVDTEPDLPREKAAEERSQLTLTAQFFPIGESESHSAALQIRRENGKWQTLGEAPIVVPGWTATFRSDDWDADIQAEYRVVWPASAKDDEGNLATWSGVIRRDPVEQETIVVAGFTGNHMVGHGFQREGYDYVENVWFPHQEVVDHVGRHNVDVLFFSGDQVYEGASPTFADTHPDRIHLDYLYKWYLWCWSYRELTRSIPTICEPDDHDVYQPNLWGQGGRKVVSPPGNRYNDGQPRDHDGGYVHSPDFVRMVERTQTSHLPTAWLQEPLEQGITAYFTDMVWGGIGFAILGDRKFKSGCNRPDMPPSGTGRPDHFNDPDFDIRKLDVPGLTLLGEDQLKFLHEFAEDWKGQQMKIAVSQTIFANMATHHGGQLQRLIADLDSNGWPQTGRNRAVDALRRGYIFHLAGDQHLATIVHHGIETHRDAIWSFCVPSVANFYPRAWAPLQQGEYHVPAPEEFTGDHRDGFNHPVTVYAATNPGRDLGREPKRLHNGMAGYGIVRMNKTRREITMECWPRFADPADGPEGQYEGWPRTISQFDNYGRRPAGWLPELHISGVDQPVIQVIREPEEVLYTVRRPSSEPFSPHTFDVNGRYSIRISDPETGRVQVLTGQAAHGAREGRRVEVKLGE